MDLVTCTELANKEIKKWGLDTKGWTFAFNNANTYAGYCVPKVKEIRISKPICLVETIEFILNTIRHEIAHALAGCHNAHNHVWKAWCRKVGCPPKATYKNRPAQAEMVLSKAKYVMCYGTKIVQIYLRKPRARTFLTISDYWAKGHKKETEGKLTIEVFNPSIHTTFL